MYYFFTIIINYHSSFVFLRNYVSLSVHFHFVLMSHPNCCFYFSEPLLCNFVHIFYSCPCIVIFLYLFSNQNIKKVTKVRYLSFFYILFLFLVPNLIHLAFWGIFNNELNNNTFVQFFSQQNNKDFHWLIPFIWGQYFHSHCAILIDTQKFICAVFLPLILSPVVVWNHCLADSVSLRSCCQIWTFSQAALMLSCWMLAAPPCKWTKQREASPSAKMGPWIWGWMERGRSGGAGYPESNCTSTHWSNNVKVQLIKRGSYHTGLPTT